MSSKKNNKTVLIAPLDWGLGHATRCIPIIRVLLVQGCQVLIATSGNHAALLQNEFPQLKILPLQGYGIRYGKGNLMLQLLRQLPSFLKSIKTEHDWLQKIIDENQIDAVISDNRYGLYSKKVPCIFITHQLQVQTPGWLKWSQPIAAKKIARLIKSFNECWVPDVAEADKSLGKMLSHPISLPGIPIKYIGWLTRFLPQKPVEKKYKLTISLSGPEPQRSLLEEELLPQLALVDGSILFIRGLPGNDQTSKFSPSSNTTVVNHLPADEMQQAISESEFFLSRCGYSTLMDLQAVAVRCIFIPTPGQTEQEYLGEEIKLHKTALVISQKNIDLPFALQKASSLQPFSSGNYQNHLLEKTIADWLATIHKS